MGWGSVLGAGAGGIAGGMIAGPAGIGGGAAIGGALGGMFFDDNGMPRYDSPGVDPNAFKYEGPIDEWKRAEALAMQREAPKLDWTQSEEARKDAKGARGYQLEALDTYRDAMQGKTPSLAELTLRRGQEDATARAANIAASARGGGGASVLASVEASRDQAANGNRLALEQSMLRAREIDAARAGFANTAGGIRSGDISTRGQDLQKVGMGADVTLRQTGLNDSLAMAYLRAQESGYDARMRGRMGYEQTRVGVAQQAAQNDWERRNREKAADLAQWSAIINGAGQLGNAFAASQRWEQERAMREREMAYKYGGAVGGGGGAYPSNPYPAMGAGSGYGTGYTSGYPANPYNQPNPYPGFGDGTFAPPGTGYGESGGWGSSGYGSGGGSAPTAPPW